MLYSQCIPSLLCWFYCQGSNKIMYLLQLTNDKKQHQVNTSQTQFMILQVQITSVLRYEIFILHL